MHGKKIVFVSISCDKDKAAWEKMGGRNKVWAEFNYTMAEIVNL